MLKVKGKRGTMLVCQDRECGHRESVSRTTNARCPNCHKRMEMRGEGDKQILYVFVDTGRNYLPSNNVVTNRKIKMYPKQM